VAVVAVRVLGGRFLLVSCFHVGRGGVNRATPSGVGLESTIQTRAFAHTQTTTFSTTSTAAVAVSCV
jgi:hypothetical protein